MHAFNIKLVRLLAVVAVMAVLVAACGEEGLLDGLGERSHEYVEGEITNAPAGGLVTTTIGIGVKNIEEARWFNEAIPSEAAPGEANYVISAVWFRGDGNTRFIQASPDEIVRALPNLEFPSVVPDQTFSITSQLVYDTASATLDIGTAAAFGFWTTTPYSIEGGSVATFRIGLSDSDTEVGRGVSSLAVPDGLNLQWASGGYTYELFCATELPEGLCWDMVESAVPLSLVAPAAASTE